MKHLFLLVVASLSLILPRSVSGQNTPFSWDQAVVYFIMTDRFSNGDPSNDNAYGRGLDETGASYDFDETGFFHGGDLAGLTSKINEGYFDDLGVNVLSITAPYEQAHGWVNGGDGDFRSYAYDGYSPLDYSSVDASFGTEEEFIEFVDAAHRKGLRVILDVVLNEAAAEETSSESMVTSLGEWVRKAGVDGFRIDSAASVDAGVLSALKAEAVRALKQWKTQNPEKAIDDAEFWMTGQVLDHGAERSDYFDVGFDSMINSEFQGLMDSTVDMDALYSRYSQAINADPTFNVLSFVSSHETRLSDREDLIDAGTSLFLLPGGIQIMYGDETGRLPGPTVSDRTQATRSSMNWDSFDAAVRAHWSKLGTFRQAHPSVAAGSHEKLGDTPYTFYRGIRLGTEIDQVVVVTGATEKVRLNVSRIWPDDTLLRDAYSGKMSLVSFGIVNFQPHENGILLIEEVR